MSITQTRATASDRVVDVIESAMPLFVSSFAIVLIWIGWLNRDEELLTPKEGAGYWLGWIGGIPMLLMFLYSIRKRMRKARSWGPIPAWFKVHMLVGVFAPILILYHANFRLGALNSNFALYTMLAVVVSGVIGRYIHGKAYAGYSGRKGAAHKALARVVEMRERLGYHHDNGAFDSIIDELEAFGAAAIKSAPRGLTSGIWTGARMWLSSRFLRLRLRRRVFALSRRKNNANRRGMREHQRQLGETGKRIDNYVNAALGAVEARVFEQLLALWHVFHFPMVFVMVLAGVVHVWAVHRY